MNDYVAQALRMRLAMLSVELPKVRDAVGQAAEDLRSQQAHLSDMEAEAAAIREALGEQAEAPA